MNISALKSFSCPVALLAFLAIIPCQSVPAPARNVVKKLDSPYVTFFANEFHRGDQYLEFLKGCKNLPAQYDNWASSINTHQRCLDVFDLPDCEGKTARIYPSSGVNTDLGLKLSLMDMNDKISSFKSCYTMMPSSRRG